MAHWWRTSKKTPATTANNSGIKNPINPMIYEAYITSGMSPQNASASKGTPAALDGALEPTTATSSNTSTLIAGLEYIDVNNINDTAYFDSYRGGP